MYFGKRDTVKPNGWFSLKGEVFEQEGFSYNLDPIYSHPNDPVSITSGTTA